MSRLKNYKEKLLHTLPTPSWSALTVIMIISCAIHLFSLVGLHNLPQASWKQPKKDKRSVPVKIRYKTVEDNSKTKRAEKKPTKILEPPLKKTEVPKKADFLGQQDHIAKKKTKAKRKPKMAKNPGGLTKNTEPKKEVHVKKNQKPLKPSKKNRPQKLATTSAHSNKEKVKPKVTFSKGLTFPKNLKQKDKLGTDYGKLLSLSRQQMASKQQKQGYQDYLNDKVQEAEAIDLNTQNYRYIGYFTNMRKAIELVWTYPVRAARRGIYGKVRILFTILENGKVSEINVLDSSGHKILDHAIVDAIKLASPFAPLPENMSKNHLNVSGTFNYVLN